MADLSDFMNRRAQVSWQVRDQKDQRQLVASSPDGLDSMTWLIPTRSAKAPRITQGQGRIERQEHHWLVSAGPGNSLGIAWTHTNPGDRP